MTIYFPAVLPSEQADPAVTAAFNIAGEPDGQKEATAAMARLKLTPVR